MVALIVLFVLTSLHVNCWDSHWIVQEPGHDDDLSHEFMHERNNKYLVNSEDQLSKISIDEKKSKPKKHCNKLEYQKYFLVS